MTFSPKLIFWVTFYAWIGSGITGGTVHLTGMIPDPWIIPVTAYLNFATFVALGFLTLATGRAGVGTGPYAPPVSRDEVRKLADDAQMTVIPKRDPAASVGKPS